MSKYKNEYKNATSKQLPIRQTHLCDVPDADTLRVCQIP
jgi:hypothetical protein